jgi:histidyl-tRNA synthetase
VAIATIQALRGMKDVLPEESPRWHYLESQIRKVVSAYSFNEIRTPLIESTHLFSRSIGEVTDIVEKEMYSFADRNGDSMTLRPEGTAGVVRSVEEHGLAANGQQQKLWYMGPMFRYERPQKGRYRQFHQFGVELFGVASADADAEILIMLATLWERLGISKAVRLQINSIGTLAARNDYKAALVTYLEQHISALDEDSQKRLATNPLRILDSKSASTQAILVNAPSMHDFLDKDSIEHFDKLKAYLDLAGIEYEVNPRLVRGLDYYSRTVFEWVTDQLGAQGTVCGGGRYDGLVEQMGGKPTPAVGFGMGCERLLLLLETLETFPASIAQVPDVYIALMGDLAQARGIELAEQVRAQLPDARVQMHLGSGSFKSQMKKADKSGARLLLILGENELNNHSVILKHLREDKDQQELSRTELTQQLAKLLSIS